MSDKLFADYTADDIKRDPIGFIKAAAKHYRPQLGFPDISEVFTAKITELVATSTPRELLDAFLKIEKFSAGQVEAIRAAERAQFEQNPPEPPGEGELHITLVQEQSTPQYYAAQAILHTMGSLLNERTTAAGTQVNPYIQKAMHAAFMASAVGQTSLSLSANSPSVVKFALESCVAGDPKTIDNDRHMKMSERLKQIRMQPIHDIDPKLLNSDPSRFARELAQAYVLIITSRADANVPGESAEQVAEAIRLQHLLGSKMNVNPSAAARDIEQVATERFSEAFSQLNYQQILDGCHALMTEWKAASTPPKGSTRFDLFPAASVEYAMRWWEEAAKRHFHAVRQQREHFPEFFDGFMELIQHLVDKEPPQRSSGEGQAR